MVRVINMIKHSQSELQKIAKQVRSDVIEMIYKAGTGHPAGSLSATDILVALYFEIMDEGDKFLLSNGHVCPALYSVWAEKGLIPRESLSQYSDLNSVLQGHPEKIRLPDLIVNTSGPLGLGLAQSVGYALATKISLPAGGRIYCMSSDAEHDEGNHLEAMLLAPKYKLNNLTLFVDRNMIQIEHGTEQILPLGDLGEKYRSFGWNVLNINGHDFDEIINAVNSAKEFKDGPTVIIAKTTAGKGVSFMEGSPDWHAKAPNEDEYKKAIQELKNE